jgi:hypothetical protein
METRDEKLAFPGDSQLSRLPMEELAPDVNANGIDQ